MLYYTTYQLPDEAEFAERDFWPTDMDPAHLPFDWAEAQYVRYYPNDTALTLTFCPGGGSADIGLTNANGRVFGVLIERIVMVDFQSWHGERVVRLYMQTPLGEREAFVHYDPVPRLVLHQP